MATYTPPPYFPQSSLSPPDKNRYLKFKLVVAALIVLLLAIIGWRDHRNRLSLQSAGLTSGALDIKSARPYSFPFRTKFPIPLVQRCYWFCRCGGVARLDAWHRSFNYCGVKLASFTMRTRQTAPPGAATLQKSFG